MFRPEAPSEGHRDPEKGFVPIEEVADTADSALDPEMALIAKEEAAGEPDDDEVQHEIPFEQRLAAALAEKPFPSSETVAAELDEEESRWGWKPPEDPIVAKEKLKQAVEDLLIFEQDKAVQAEKAAQLKDKGWNPRSGAVRQSLRHMSQAKRGVAPFPIREKKRKHKKGGETLRMPGEKLEEKTTIDPLLDFTPDE